ncbi:MAG: hypothetical protein COT18_05460, partial [Elusimicrobia bacterium CG08_land_8_20_14_0_20_59_10]
FSHRFFWVYVLPLTPFILEALSNPISRVEVVKGALPGIVLNLPWYLFAAVAVAAGFVPLHGEYQGILACLKMGVNAAGLPLFVLGALALAWMYYSVFMPYSKKGVVAAWFWVSYLALTFLVRGDRPELMYPALLPFAIALPVMTPHAVRKYLVAFVLLLGLANQSGLAPELSLKGYRLTGLPRPPATACRADDILNGVRSGLPPGGGLVGLYGADSNLNVNSLRFASVKEGWQAKFANDPACPACPGVLIYKAQSSGAASSRSAFAFLQLRAQPWFAELFGKKTVIELGDGSKAEIYVKRPPRCKVFEEGPHELRNLVLGPLSMENATLKTGGYDAASGLYARGELFSPTALLKGGDIYGFTVELEGLRLAGTPREPVLAGAKHMRVLSARISAYTVEKYLGEQLPLLTGLKVSIEDTLEVSAVVRGMALNAGFSLSMSSPGVIDVKPAVFSMGPVDVPGFLLQFFSFRMDFSDNPYNLKVSGLRVSRQMLEIY